MDQVDDDCLLVMYKPDGLRRQCVPAEVERINEGWMSVLHWLRGSDPDGLQHRDLINDVARKAALRMVRYPAYDIRTWAAQAATLPPTAGQLVHDSTTDPSPLVTVFGKILTGIGLRQSNNRRGHLRIEIIEQLYGAAPNFQHNRQLLVPGLLDGPVLIQRWDGDRTELALGGKFLVRRALSSAGITNLLHVTSTSGTHADRIISDLALRHPGRTAP